MNKMWTIIFFFLPLLGFAYIGWHVWKILPLPSVWRWIAVGLMALCLIIFFGNFFTSLDTKPMTLAEALYEIGDSTIFIALYVLMIFLLLDLGRLLHVVPRSFVFNSLAGSLTVTILTVAIFIYGNIHYNDKVRVPLTLKSEKLAEKPLRIVMVSDLHVGYHNRKAEFNRWIDIINGEKPDLILICGDIIDGSIRALDEQGIGSDFHRLKAPVYACLGNHEYYAGRSASIAFYRRAGIRLLIDSVATPESTVADSVTRAALSRLVIVGRDDRSNGSRKSLAELMRGIDKSKYVILLDHQPYHLEEAQRAGVDFQLSGHTHHGQVWPISWITDAIYEDAFGPYQKGSTRYYVSSGLGIWGGKFRIGTRSEYVVAEVRS